MNAPPGTKLALVLDIDETALSNWDEIKQDDFGYIERDWDDWINKEQASPISGTLRLYNEALKLKVSIFFITGRLREQEASTVSNLESAGYHDWTGLVFRGPDSRGQTVADYKSSERKKIVYAGYRLILNVGDQLSDMSGDPNAELSIKLPNPFYYIP
jgi:acid phosphatase